ncbi:MAG: hypothetical protein M1544_01810 [Candidatus Marsarchaeota archaeon]|nr:hypothetical protein [Candidatus Marsarchaeota archaeon]
MKKIMPSEYRYPLFFLAFMVIGAAGLLSKYAALGLDYTAVIVAIGFLMFLFSIVLP